MRNGIEALQGAFVIIIGHITAHQIFAHAVGIGSGWIQADKLLESVGRRGKGQRCAGEFCHGIVEESGLAHAGVGLTLGSFVESKQRGGIVAVAKQNLTDVEVG